MKMLDYDAAHKFVNHTPDAFWDGWEIVVWKPQRNAYSNRSGMFRNGRWGIARKYSVNPDGLWAVPGR